MSNFSSPLSYGTAVAATITAALHEGRLEIDFPTNAAAQKFRFQIYGYLRRLPNIPLKINFKQFECVISDTKLTIQRRNNNELNTFVLQSLAATLGLDKANEYYRLAEDQQLMSQAYLDKSTLVSLKDLGLETTDAGIPSADTAFDPDTFSLG